MSRDIKFKIWDKEQKKFLEINWEGEDTRHTKGKANICYSDRVYVTLSGYVDEDGWPYEVDADILQYTGFEDTKNKEIYEGDILHVTKVSMCGVDKYNVAEYNTDVKWEDGAFVIKGDADVECYDTWLAAYNNPDSPQIEIEVIGNIYENPELLRSEE